MNLFEFCSIPAGTPIDGFEIVPTCSPRNQNGDSWYFFKRALSSRGWIIPEHPLIPHIFVSVAKDESFTNDCLRFNSMDLYTIGANGFYSHGYPFTEEELDLSERLVEFKIGEPIGLLLQEHVPLRHTKRFKEWMTRILLRDQIVWLRCRATDQMVEIL